MSFKIQSSIKVPFVTPVSSTTSTTSVYSMTTSGGTPQHYDISTLRTGSSRGFAVRATGGMETDNR